MYFCAYLADLADLVYFPWSFDYDSKIQKKF